MLPCRLQIQPGETISAMMVDVSLSGCRVACANEDSKACEDLLNTGRDTPVTLSLRLTSESELLEITGRLKSVDTKQDNTFTGVAFENLDDATRQALTRFIQEAEMYSAS
jgi:c-di-GMP-binding flagellar brake protein YcgR